MKYMLLIQQGTTPTPDDPEAWNALSPDEQRQVWTDYQAINETPGVAPGERMQAPDTATTVRVQDGAGPLRYAAGCGRRLHGRPNIRRISR